MSQYDGRPMQPYQGQGYAPSPPGKGLAITSLVLGLVSILLCLWCFTGVPGMIFGFIGHKQLKGAGAPTGMATAGIVLSIIGTALAVLFVLLSVIFPALFTGLITAAGIAGM